MENERFQSGNRGLLCSFRNQYNYILSFVSKLALVLLLNTNERFQDSKRSVLCGIRNPFLCIQKSIKSSNLFEDPDSVRDTGRTLVLLLNLTPSEYRSLEMNSRDTYARFQSGKRSMLCNFWNLYRFILFVCNQ